MSLKHKAAWAATMAALMGVAGTAQAQAVFEGRDASGAASNTCTASGPGKCAYFYFAPLDITILNNWSIGSGPWGSVLAPGSAQALAEAAGFAASGLSQWYLPTVDGEDPYTPGWQNQFPRIFEETYLSGGLSS